MRMELMQLSVRTGAKIACMLQTAEQGCESVEVFSGAFVL